MYRNPSRAYLTKTNIIPLIFYPFFNSFKIFFLHLKKKLKLKLFFFILVHTYYYTYSNIYHPSLPIYLSLTLCFTITLPSSFFVSYILTLLLPILIFMNLRSFISFNTYFFHTKIVSTLSLSLSTFFWWIFILSCNSN